MPQNIIFVKNIYLHQPRTNPGLSIRRFTCSKHKSVKWLASYIRHEVQQLCNNQMNPTLIFNTFGDRTVHVNHVPSVT